MTGADDEERTVPDADETLRGLASAEGDEGDELSLEQLAAAYARALGVESAPDEEADATGEEDLEIALPEPASTTGYRPSPAAIVEAALFVGHPENKGFPADSLARLMRNVTPAEIDAIVDALNEEYLSGGHAMRIVAVADGYRMQLASEALPVRDAFYGRVRDARLSQAAVDVLALVAYHPGIAAPELDAKRGKPTGPLVNQLVRRQLVEVRREERKGKGQPRPPARYYPTERLLNIIGIERLEDLPHVQ